MFENINIENLHHAYVIQGSTDVVLPLLENFLTETLDYDLQGNPDYTYRVFETLGVDDARALSLDQMRKSISGNKKIFVISFQGITVEAQNALLKVFEEPTEHTHFFIIVDSFDRLLPTLQSRVFFLSKHEGPIADIQKIGKKFLSSTLAERVKQIEELHEKKDKAGAKMLLNGIEFVLYEQMKKNSSKELQDTLHQVISVKGYVDDRSPSLKMLLEHIAHITPVV
jgi:DNA polymerase III delta prime subunit